MTASKNNVLKEKAKIFAKNLYWDLYEKKKLKSKTLFPEDIESDCLYIISRDEYNGMFSYIEMCMRYMEHAIKINQAPIIDMTGCINPYVKRGEEKEVNWWELYFEQPMKSSKSIGDYQCVNRCVYEDSCGIPYGRSAVLLKKSRWFWGNMYSHYFHLKDDVQNYVDSEWKKLFGEGHSKILGVKLRGTDYKVVDGHPIQPDIYQIIAEVRKVQDRFDRIYIATEEYSNVKVFKELFSGKIIANDESTYFDLKNGELADRAMFEVEDNEYQSGLEYLSSIMILSKCDGLIGGINGGTVAATYINNGKYDYIKLFYLGIG